MQARYARFAAAAALVAALDLVASAAAAQEADRHVFVTEAASSIGSANGGIWKTTNGAAAETPPSEVSNGPAAAQTDGVMIVRALFGLSGAASAGAPSDVATAPAEGSTDYLLRIEGVDGESSQASHPSGDGVVVLDSSLPAGSGARRGTGTVTLTNGNGAALDPEQPVCGHCGAHAQAQAPEQGQANAQEQEQPRRRRSNFSIGIGGVSIGSGGVSVATGDVDGDGARAGRQHAPVRVRAPSGQ